jgi:hypothetical protein
MVPFPLLSTLILKEEGQKDKGRNQKTLVAGLFTYASELDAAPAVAGVSASAGQKIQG